LERHIGKDAVFWEENPHADLRQLELGFDLLFAAETLLAQGGQ
jgi:hypothetical protein